LTTELRDVPSDCCTFQAADLFVLDIQYLMYYRNMSGVDCGTVRHQLYDMIKAYRQKLKTHPLYRCSVSLVHFPSKYHCIASQRMYTQPQYTTLLIAFCAITSDLCNTVNENYTNNSEKNNGHAYVLDELKLNPNCL